MVLSVATASSSRLFLTTNTSQEAHVYRADQSDWRACVCTTMYARRKKRDTLTLTQDCSIHVDRLPAGDCSSRLSQSAAPFSFEPSPRAASRIVTGGSVASIAGLGSERDDCTSFLLLSYCSQTLKHIRLVRYATLLGPFCISYE